MACIGTKLALKSEDRKMISYMAYKPFDFFAGKNVLISCDGSGFSEQSLTRKQLKHFFYFLKKNYRSLVNVGPLPLDEAAHEVEMELLRLPQVGLLVLAGGGAELAARVGERARLGGGGGGGGGGGV